MSKKFAFSALIGIYTFTLTCIRSDDNVLYVMTKDVNDVAHIVIQMLMLAIKLILYTHKKPYMHIWCVHVTQTHELNMVVEN